MMTAAWQRKEGQDPKGGLNAKGRASLRAEGRDIKAPAPNPKTKKDASRRESFCARMGGMKKKDRQVKGQADKISAVLILQDYMQGKKN